MRRLVILALVALLALTLAAPAWADEGDPHGHLCAGVNVAGKPNASAFAEHVVHHAQEGLLGAEHHPGMHRGYSICVPGE